jgi:hypothetical protein
MLTAKCRATTVVCETESKERGRPLLVGAGRLVLSLKQARVSVCQCPGYALQVSSQLTLRGATACFNFGAEKSRLSRGRGLLVVQSAPTFCPCPHKVCQK